MLADASRHIAHVIAQSARDGLGQIKCGLHIGVDSKSGQLVRPAPCGFPVIFAVLAGPIQTEHPKRYHALSCASIHFRKIKQFVTEMSRVRVICGDGTRDAWVPWPRRLPPRPPDAWPHLGGSVRRSFLAVKVDT